MEECWHPTQIVTIPPALQCISLACEYWNWNVSGNIIYTAYLF